MVLHYTEVGGDAHLKRNEDDKERVFELSDPTSQTACNEARVNGKEI